MTSFHRILVPTDFSDCSHAACDMALKLALKFGASITLLHIQEPPAWQGFVIPELVVGMPTDVGTSVTEVVVANSKRLMEQRVENLRRAGVTEVRHRMEAGEPSALILQVAEEEPFDLIVMGTHGRQGFERLMMGSVAERVVRQAASPVLTVRAANVMAAGDAGQST